jgi:hypothetical protein
VRSRWSATLVLAGLGGMVGQGAGRGGGDRRAGRGPEPAACAGCDLVAGCRDATVTEPGSEPGARTGLTREA